MGIMNGPLWGQNCLSSHVELIRVEGFFSAVTPGELFGAQHRGIRITPAFGKMLNCVSVWVKPATPVSITRRLLVGFSEDRRILRELPAERYSFDHNLLGWVLGEMVLEQKHAVGTWLKQAWREEQEARSVFYTPAYAVEVRHRDDCSVFVLDARHRRIEPSPAWATGTCVYYPTLAG